jgi:hypothetical protein
MRLSLLGRSASRFRLDRAPTRLLAQISRLLAARFPTLATGRARGERNYRQHDDYGNDDSDDRSGTHVPSSFRLRAARMYDALRALHGPTVLKLKARGERVPHLPVR